jgi:hypothetical protein
MSQLVKTKRQANFKDLKRFGAFKGLVEQKTLYSNLFGGVFHFHNFLLIFVMSPFCFLRRFSTFSFLCLQIEFFYTYMFEN